jgi:hypothetical protein
MLQSNLEIRLATVQELKDGLLAEQSKTVEVADSAIAAIDTILNLSTYVLTILGVIIALLAIFGYAFIASSARKAAKEVATDAMDSYIKSQEFADRMQGAVESEVKRRMANKFIVANLTEEQDGGEPDPFPSAEEAKRQ